MTLWRRAARWLGDRVWEDGPDDPRRATADDIALYVSLWFGVWGTVEFASVMGMLPELVADLAFGGGPLLGGLVLWLHVPQAYGPPALRGIGIALIVGSCMVIPIWDFLVSAPFILTLSVGCWMAIRTLQDPRRL